MDKDNLQNIISGLLSLILTVLGYMLSQANEDIRMLKHETDLHVSEANQRLEQAESELNDIWAKYNKDNDDSKAEMRAEFDAYIGVLQRLHATEIELEKLKK